jgi:hypothetical protein
LFSKIKPNGVYVCEDLATSYHLGYGGGYKRRGTFIEFSKNLIDKLNAFHSEQKSFQVNQLTTSIDSLHYYDNVLVIEKRLRDKPIATKTGVPVFGDDTTFPTKGFVYDVLYFVNKILQFLRLPSFKLNK